MYLVFSRDSEHDLSVVSQVGDFVCGCGDGLLDFMPPIRTKHYIFEY